MSLLNAESAKCQKVDTKASRNVSEPDMTLSHSLFNPTNSSVAKAVSIALKSDAKAVLVSCHEMWMIGLFD